MHYEDEHKVYSLNEDWFENIFQCIKWIHRDEWIKIGLNSCRFFCLAELIDSCNVAWMIKLIDFVTFQFAHLSFLLLLFLLCGQYFVSALIFWVIIDFLLFYYSYSRLQTMSGRFKQESYLDRGKKLFYLLFHTNVRSLEAIWTNSISLNAV